MVIYANIERGNSYYGEDYPVEIINKNGNWFTCKFPDGKIRNIHREYMTSTSVGELDESV